MRGYATSVAGAVACDAAASDTPAGAGACVRRVVARRKASRARVRRRKQQALNTCCCVVCRAEYGECHAAKHGIQRERNGCRGCGACEALLILRRLGVTSAFSHSLFICTISLHEGWGLGSIRGGGVVERGGVCVEECALERRGGERERETERERGAQRWCRA